MRDPAKQREYAASARRAFAAQLARMSPEERKAIAVARGNASWRKRTESGPINLNKRIATPKSRRNGQAIGGPISRHVRWHVNREIQNPKCELCMQEQTANAVKDQQ